MMNKTNTDPTGASTGLAGRVLIATPHLEGGVFDRSVVLIGVHDQQGAFGLILNKPIKGVQARDALDFIELEPTVTAGTQPICIGGPVTPRQGFVLHTLDFNSPKTQVVPGGFGITADRRALERLKGDQFRPQRSRLFAGYAGWSAGQLEGELRREAWLDIPATNKFIFDTPPENMWKAAMAEIGVSDASFWTYGTDPDAGSRPLN